jgi:hypothetical protein
MRVSTVTFVDLAGTEPNAKEPQKQGIFSSFQSLEEASKRNAEKENQKLSNQINNDHMYLNQLLLKVKKGQTDQIHHSTLNDYLSTIILKSNHFVFVFCCCDFFPEKIVGKIENALKRILLSNFVLASSVRKEKDKKSLNEEQSMLISEKST